MAANKMNIKQISDDLKTFLTKEMENNTKKITRIEIIDRKAQAAEPPAKQNQNNISNLTSESTALQEKLAEQTHRPRKYMSLRRTLKTKLTEILNTCQS